MKEASQVPPSKKNTNWQPCSRQFGWGVRSRIHVHITANLTSCKVAPFFAKDQGAWGQHRRHHQDYPVPPLTKCLWLCSPPMHYHDISQPALMSGVLDLATMTCLSHNMIPQSPNLFILHLFKFLSVIIRCFLTYVSYQWLLDSKSVFWPTYDPIISLLLLPLPHTDFPSTSVSPPSAFILPILLHSVFA